MAILSFQDRLDKTQNALLSKLFQIMIKKKTNLCASPNVDTVDEVLKFVDQVGPHICILKTQCERIQGGYSVDLLEALYKKKKQYNFLLFEDRKFFDGEETIEKIYTQSYIKYFDLVTANPEYKGTLIGLENSIKKVKLPDDEPRGFLAVCELSFKGAINLPDSVELKVGNADASPSCCGIISQKLPVSDPYKMIKLTPGVHISRSSDGGGQQWNHPDQVIANGADVIIVGRGITQAEDIEQAAIAYKEAAYRAYEKLLE